MLRTFPIRPARLVHVHMGVYQAWGHYQITIVQDVLQPKGEHGRMRKICLRGLPVDSLDVYNPAPLHMDCAGTKGHPSKIWHSSAACRRSIAWV